MKILFTYFCYVCALYTLLLYYAIIQYCLSIHYHTSTFPYCTSLHYTNTLLYLTLHYTLLYNILYHTNTLPYHAPPYTIPYTNTPLPYPALLYRYYSSLDGTGQRMDKTSRPELQYGSVDYIVNTDYCIRPIQEPIYVFAIDISIKAIPVSYTHLTLPTNREV